MDMVCKRNSKQTCNQEHKSAAPGSNDQLLLALLYAVLFTLFLALLLALFLVLIEWLKNLFQQVKDWFRPQRMARGILRMMKRQSPIGDEHDEGKKKKVCHTNWWWWRKKEKENNIKTVCQSPKCFCGICFDFKAESDMFRGGKCNHPFCTDCISKHVAAQIQQNVLKVNCPNPNCHVELKPEYLQLILPKEVIDRWEYARYESSIPLSQKFYCPFKNCSGLLVNEGDGGNVVTSSVCPYCHRLFCAQCKVPWHAGMNCKEFQKSKRSKCEKELDKKFLELAESKMWQRCPKCSVVVQRLGGCEHMTCIICGCNFCYKCGKNWKFGHVCNSRPST